MTNEEIARFFNTTRPFIQGNPDLRDPQVEGWFRTRQHFRNSSEHAEVKRLLEAAARCEQIGPDAKAEARTTAYVLGATEDLEPGEAQQLGQVVIHKKDMTIQTEHTYGKDPYPPKG